MTGLREWSARQFAAAGITAQFLALIRTLSEVFRVKHFLPQEYTLRTTDVFVAAALFTAVLVAAAVATFAFGRHRIALAIAIVNIVGLLVYKVAFM
jgi:hypothetical protein